MERGAGEIGVPVVGKMSMRRETLAMVYMCEVTHFPFLVAVEKAR